MTRQLCIAILGPTAIGKSSFAVELAKILKGEILCMDSTTVYKGLDIGSSKPTPEQKAQVPHHLLDVIAPDEPFSAGHFVRLADKTIEDILSRKRVPIIVGGTYFYLKALQHGMYVTPPVSQYVLESIDKEFFNEDDFDSGALYQAVKEVDPKSAENLHPNDRYRLIRALAVFRVSQKRMSELSPEPLSEESKNRIWMKYSLTISRHKLNQKIVERTEQMLREGLVEETRKLHEKYPDAKALKSIGYNEAVLLIQKQLTEKQIKNEIIDKTRQLAKRQMTWLRSDPEVRYIDSRDLDRVQLEFNNLSYALKGNA